MLLSDDISMGALDGGFAERTRRALDAGCDLVLHCTGVLAEMAEIVEAARPISPAAEARIARGETLRRRGREDFDRRAAELRFAELMAGRQPGAKPDPVARMNPPRTGPACCSEATTWVLPVIFAVTFHEAAHGFVAYRFGDDTA